jgi:hypothetical protein
LPISNLLAGTTCCFRVMGSNSAGTINGDILSFTTKLSTTTTLTSSLNPSTYGSSVTFTSTVSPSTASGTVTFKDGTNTLGTGTLSGGVATFATNGLSVGNHSMTVAYGGDSSYAASTSSPLTQTVSKADPNVTTWPTATAIPYGRTLASSTLSGGAASVAGSFAFTAPATTPPVGTAAQSVTFTPADTANYNSVSGTASVTVNPAGYIGTGGEAPGLVCLYEFKQTLSDTLANGLNLVPVDATTASFTADGWRWASTDPRGGGLQFDGPAGGNSIYTNWARQLTQPAPTCSVGYD